MKNNRILVTIISAIFFLGILGTNSFVLGSPPQDNPGQPFAAITALLEEIKMELSEASTEILTAIGILSNDVALVQSDIDLLETEISLIKTDLATIKSNTDGIGDDFQILEDKIDGLEPLTKFKNLVDSVSEFGNDTKISTREIDSTGPMIVEVCKRSGIGQGDFGNDNHEGEGIVKVKTLPGGAEFEMSEEGIPECRSVGVNPDEAVRLTLIADAGVIDIARVTADVSIRTTPSSTISVSDPVIEVID